MQLHLRRTAAVALALLFCLPAVIATDRAEPAPGTLRQPIDWVPQNVVEAVDLPPLDAPLAEPTGPSIPELYTGIGTGSALLMGPVVGSVSFLCTAAFLFKDSVTGEYYLGTAGHCLVRDETETSPHSGYVDPQTTNNEIRICVRQCLNNALQLGTYVRLYRGMPGAPAGYDPVLFAQSGGIGSDFGLIRIPPILNNQLRAHMPQFGGPSGMAGWTTAGDLIAHYGHGTYCCPVVGGVSSRTPVDQGRVSVSAGGDLSSFSFAGWSSGGDSGSGMSLASPSATRGIQGTAALGVLTHGLITGGVGFGTMLPRGLQMVQAYRATHPTLPTVATPALVKGSDTICTANCSTLPPAAPAVRITSPANGTSFAADIDTMQVTGTVNRASTAGPQAAPMVPLPFGTQAASLVRPTGGQDLYMKAGVPVGNVDRAMGGASLVPEPPTSATPSVTAHVASTPPAEAVPTASWTYRGPVDLADADITVAWFGHLASSAAVETWEAHVHIGAAQIATSTLPHASASGTFTASPNAQKSLTIRDVQGAGDNLVVVLRSSSATTPAIVLFGSSGFPSGIRVVENGGTTINTPPTAAFNCTAVFRSVSCDGSASSDDVGIASYAWNFGDGGTASGATASHTYATAGTKTVTLTVTDTQGATGVLSRQVTVTNPPPQPEQVQLLINGTLVASRAVDSTTPGDHAWNATLSIGFLPAGSHTLTAVWLSSDNVVQDTDQVTFHVQSGNTGTSTSTSSSTSSTSSSTTGTATTGTNSGNAGGSVNNVAPAVDTLAATPSVAVLGSDDEVGLDGTAHDDNGNEDVASVTVKVTAPGGASSFPAAGIDEDPDDVTALSFAATHAIAADAETGTYQVDSFATDAAGLQSEVVSVTFTVLPPSTESVELTYTGAAERLDFGAFDPGQHNVTSGNAFVVTNSLGRDAHFLFDMTDFECSRGGVPVMGNANVILGSVDQDGTFTPLVTKGYTESTVDFGTLSDGASLAVKLMLHTIPKGIAGTCTGSFGLYHT